MNVLGLELARSYEEVPPMEFYREVFPAGELDDWGDCPEDRHKGRYCGIAVQITRKKTPKGKPLVKRFTVTDDLDTIDALIWCDDFCVMAPISYAGKNRSSKNARFMYALVVELDNLKVSKTGRQVGLKELMSQWSEKVKWIPCPSFCVASGTGVHLYYVFSQAIPLFDNVVKSLQEYKRKLTEMIWNKYVTTTYTPDTIQQESIFQGFRMVGTITKKRDRVQAFRTGDKVSIEYMNSFIPRDYLKRHPECQIEKIYKSELSKAEAKAKYPEWYERRVERGEPKGHWICSPAVYNWWYDRIEAEAVVGHRYYCLMMLAIYAVKCDISQEKLESDCLKLMEVFEKKTDNENNHFTEKDVLDALQSFEDKGLITYPINSISNRSGLVIEKNKRNFQPRAWHLEDMRTKKVNMKRRGQSFKNPEGRPPKDKEVLEYLEMHPECRNVSQIARACEVSRTTVYKYLKKD